MIKQYTDNLICISATFTAEPVQPVLEFWAAQLGESWEVSFAPFNQVLQTLLDPAGPFAANRDGANVVLVRPQDLAQFAGATEADRRERVTELLRLLAQVRFAVPLLVAFCPPEPVAWTPPPGVYAIDTAAYPVADWQDAAGEKLGAIPYTEEYFAALGTAIARLLHSLTRPPYKVLALDCDHTLWDGVCGEDGPTGVRIDEPRRHLQELLLAKRANGLLLALASKNNPEDVRETFAAHPEMILQLEHITAERLNWEPKSRNIRSMAAELSLGSDSFILLDDNPKEIAELAEGAPEVLGLTLPADAAALPEYLAHVWAFDQPAVTAADRQRAASYDQQREFRQAASTDLAHFYATLALTVAIDPLAEADLARAAQLTQRTNQFNFTTIRRSEPEIAAMANRVFTIRVADRFGDYGLTGLLILDGDRVTDFLLSCRVLGRGVEHAVARWLGARTETGFTFTVDPTPRNAPAQSFFAELTGEKTGTATVAAATLRELQFVPAEAPVPVAEAGPAPVERRFTGYQHIATQLRRPAEILEAIRAAQKAGAAVRQVSALPVTETEQKLAAIWSDLLRQPVIGIEDNFFDLGGHSLLAVLLVTRVEEAFGIELSMDDVYSADTTLGKLAQIIETQQLSSLGASEMDELLAEIEGLSDEEVRALLAEQDNQG